MSNKARKLPNVSCDGFLRACVVYNSPLWRPSANPGTVTRIHVACQLGLCCLGLHLDLELLILKMYQAAEEGEGGRDVGESASVEARPGSRNSAETPLNPSKLVHPFPLT